MLKHVFASSTFCVSLEMNACDRCFVGFHLFVDAYGKAMSAGSTWFRWHQSVGEALPCLPPVALGFKMKCKGCTEILVSGLECSNLVCQGLALSPFC